jgi:hypothetical protein
MIGGVSRHRLPWLVAIPLMVAGSVSAHELGYWLVMPDTDARAAFLAGTGHGYFEHLPLVLGVLGSMVAVGLSVRALGVVRGHRPAAASSWWLFALPLLGFTVQEHLERLLQNGAFPVDAVLQPTFVVGLLLQLPFALAALMVARTLVETAERLAVRLARPRRSLPRRVALAFPPAVDVVVRPIPALALGYAERGPPPALSR